MLEVDKSFSKRIKKTRSNRPYNGSSTTSPWPSGLVCQPSAAHPDAMEVGVVLCLLILVVYSVGFYETFQALPETPAEPHWRAHMGQNFNLAVPTEWSSQLPNDDAKALGGNDSQNNAAAGVAQRSASSEIPVGHWPVSIRDELDNFETMIHPGDLTTEMSLPRLWSKPIHHGGLMTRETALKVGTCATPDPTTGSAVRGDDCPVEARTIFVAIASYRDFQCRLTVESAFKRAKHPERLRIGVVDQIVDGEDVVCNEPVLSCDKDPTQALCKYKNQVDVYEMEAELSIGPVFARHIGHRMYRGEYYATQSDAHVTFTQDWDMDIISQMESTGNEMTVLSTYLTDIQGSIDENGNSLRQTRPIMCNTYYEGGSQGMHLRHGSQPERFPVIKGTPQLQPWWAAGYSFSRGHFVVNVPYDPYQPMIFQGEEMSIGIRGFTIGYDFYAPERSVCFHHYAVGENAKVRSKVHHFWENGTKYAGTGKKAMQRLLGIVHMNPEVPISDWDHTEEEMYGLGGVRTPEKFYKTFGIDVVKKTTEGHLCGFVDTNNGRMHRLFSPKLRSDGMGIDYGQISFEYKDPRPGQK